MACPEREAKLIDWILEELAPSEIQELEQHVQRCADCSRGAGRLRQLHGALLRNLSDREMPAHLVFVPEQPKRQFAGLLNSLWRTAALTAAAAVVFVVIVVGGTRWRGWLPAAGSPRLVGLTEADVKTLAAQEVERQMALQRHDLEAANEKLAVSLRDEQSKNLDRLARQVEYVESVQNSVWKQTAQQGAMVDLIARNSLEPKVLAPGKR